MAAQTWMVPQQKYDVIHYIREAYLKPDNPLSTLASIGHTWTSFPRGRAEGPAPVGDRALERDGLRAEPVGDCRSRQRSSRTSPSRGSPSGSTRGRGGSRGASLGASTTTTRCAWPPPGPARDSSTGTESTSTAATRFILGSSARSMSPTRTAPAGQIPNDQSFADLRIRGRDGRLYGPLPRRWAHFKGLYRHGDRVILAYTVGTTDDPRNPGPRDRPGAPDQSDLHAHPGNRPVAGRLDDARGRRRDSRQPGWRMVPASLFAA